ncbi:MAG: phytoene/squalene synthase family protein [Rhodobacteraceae bacterium]|nr:phytoene/squalene synthase family protein [Paracoccaceae bacterium]
MIDPRDVEHCREAIRHGSRSFHAASRLLPASVRDPALALYAFCRLADDAVDEHDEKSAAVLRLRDRLDLIYAGMPKDAPADRAFAAVVEEFDMPKALPDALLEGLAWDAVGRHYETLEELYSYSARVASAVGVMVCVLMRVRDADTLARAADLGIAMQLTNISRDVGEDARAGRLYLPTAWLAEAGVDVTSFMADPQPCAALRDLVRRLMCAAERLYDRSEAGVSALPVRARPAIFAARHAYAGIGAELVRLGHDSVTRRAVTSGTQKFGWLVLSAIRAGLTSILPQSAVLHAQPLPETAFLVDAATKGSVSGSWGTGRAGVLMAMLAQLEAQDQAARAKAVP